MASPAHCLKRLRMNHLLRSITRAISSFPPALPPSSSQIFTTSFVSPPSLNSTFNPTAAFRFSASFATADASSPSAPSTESISITDSCVKRLQQMKQEDGVKAEGKMLRVTVEGGGCSGFQYIFTLVDKFGTSDRIFEKDGAKVVVDDISMGFIKGATIDYAEELIRSSFMVTQNPNASNGCGCGSSFTIK